MTPKARLSSFLSSSAISLEIEQHRIATCVARFNFPNLSDKHLEYILCVWKRENDIPVEWVVWMHNKEDHGFYQGHYCRTLDDAVDIFNEKKGQLLLEQPTK